MSELDYLEWEKRRSSPQFQRTAVRRRKLKTPLDCGHVIDGSELYRYHVCKYLDEPLYQRTDCQQCARKDDHY